jgi:hypothetical protein
LLGDRLRDIRHRAETCGAGQGGRHQGELIRAAKSPIPCRICRSIVRP